MHVFKRRLHHFLRDKAAVIVQQMHPHLTLNEIESAIASNYNDEQFAHDAAESHIPLVVPDPEANEEIVTTGAGLGGGQVMAWLESFYTNHKQLCDIVIAVMVQIALKALGL